MPNIFHQSAEDILKAATPEQKLLWNYIFLRFGERVPISQFYLTGSIPAELSNYSANRLYVAYSMEFSRDSSGVSMATPSSVLLYNELNALHFAKMETFSHYDNTAAAARYHWNNVELNNIYFSRVAVASYLFVKFIGYRIGI